MKNKLVKGLMLSVVCGTLLTACGSKEVPKLENGEDAIVSFNDGTMISVNELYEKLKNDYGFDILLELIDKTIFEKEFPDEIEAAKSDAANTMEQLKGYYGDQLESAIQQYTSYKTVDQYENYLYIAYFQEKVSLNYSKEQIKNSEINKYYKNDYKSDIKVSHILFSVDYSDDATEEEQSAAKEAAKTKAQEVLDKLKATKGEVSNTFAEYAKDYSDDDSNKNDGGNLGFINEDTLGTEYDDLVTEAYKLKDGEISSKIVETELGYHIIYRTETKAKPSIEEVRDSIKTTLAETYFNENSQEVYIKSMQDIRNKYGMEIQDESLATYYKNYIQNALLSVQTQNSK